METGQNRTVEQNQTEVSVREDSQYQALIEFKAINGTLTDENGQMRKLSMEDFAQMIGVVRSTVYEWMKRPGFWDEVNKARKTVSSKSRLSKVHDVMFLSALKPGSEGYRDRVLYLANFDENFRMPQQKVEHELGNSWAKLMSARTKQPENIIEGEVSDGPQKEV